jgi:hypothetical protein
VAIPIIKPICFIDSSTVLRSLRCAVLVSRSLPSFASFQGSIFANQGSQHRPSGAIVNPDESAEGSNQDTQQHMVEADRVPTPAKTSASPVTTICQSASVANKERWILHAPVSKSYQIPVSSSHEYALAFDSYPAVQLDV